MRVDDHGEPLAEIDRLSSRPDSLEERRWEGPLARPTAKRWVASGAVKLQMPEGAGPVIVVTGFHVPPPSAVA